LKAPRTVAKVLGRLSGLVADLTRAESRANRKLSQLTKTGVGVEKVGDGNAFLGWDDCGSRVFSFYLS
jgi:hypothetical protein